VLQQASPLPVVGGPYTWPDWIVDTSQVVGAAGTVAAIVLATLALFRAETVAAVGLEPGSHGTIDLDQSCSPKVPTRCRWSG
jgi:hypothetical protein